MDDLAGGVLWDEHERFAKQHSNNLGSKVEHVAAHSGGAQFDAATVHPIGKETRRPD